MLPLIDTLFILIYSYVQSNYSYFVSLKKLFILHSALFWLIIKYHPYWAISFSLFQSSSGGLRAVIPYFDSCDLTTPMQYAVPPGCFSCERRPLLYQKLPMLVGSF